MEIDRDEYMNRGKIMGNGIQRSSEREMEDHRNRYKIYQK